MPATEKYWRDIGRMHVVFAISSLAMLAATVWMMYKDHNVEWHGYQRKFYKIEADQLKAKERQVETPAYEADVAEWNAKKEQAKAEQDTHRQELKKLDAEIQTAQGNYARADRDAKFKRAERDVARANFDLGVRDSVSSERLSDLKNTFDEFEKVVAERELVLQEATTKRDAVLAEKRKLTAKEEEAAAQVKKLDMQFQQYHKALVKLEPDNAFMKFKRDIMEWPILDGFNSHLRIRQDWVPTLTLNYGGMRDVARFDRCRTCHLGIDRVEAGNLPSFPADQFHQPFSTHPRPDVYLSASSPHPLPKFGCTVCHSGQGSGTSFSNASHTPNSPDEEHKWTDEHHFASNHYWEYPMHPERFEESSCIKCHHNVVELGVNPKFGATAPKVFEGYNIIREYGCFGCHEINGFDGSRPVGPDLRLEPQTADEAARIAADKNAVAGSLRKVGPALSHLAGKTTPAWTAHWTEMPSRFRPTTRMPSFFKQMDAHGHLVPLEGQQDDKASQLGAVEIAALTHYLFEKSTPIALLKPADDYQADAERGKLLFSQRGCLACHTHQDFPDSKADFGPELSKVHSKLKPGKEGAEWLYTWIRDPQRHHPRTKMPNLFLESYKSGDTTTDPAADIAAYLLQGGPEDYQPVKVDRGALNDLVVLYLKKVLPEEKYKAFMQDGWYPVTNREELKGDEIELYTGPAGGGGKPMDENMLLNYVGRRTISRYGCYGCHDIPGFDKARPIGTALQDWGRKDTSKLAMEHIEEFLHHHGQPDGSSTAELAEDAVRKAVNGEYTDPAEQARDTSVAFYYESLLHHGRPGFLWQKLRAPRSYDYEKIETKGYDERLRMPKFPFTPDQIEAVATFVLGLVADPPSSNYLYQPTGSERYRVEGEKLLTKFNCTGCHMVDMPEIRFGTDPDALPGSELAAAEYPNSRDLLLKLKPPHKAETGQKLKLKDGTELPVLSFHGLVYGRPDLEGDIEDQEYSYDLWETMQVGDKILFPGSRMLVPAANQVSVTPARGGEFAEWLVEALMKASSETNRYLAWQMSPPPLYKEGIKVQTPWLYNFLRNPYQIRHTTVLRMPRFNMSDAEASILANYFAAVDGAEFPYQDVPQREPEYLLQLRGAHPEYLADSWKVLNAPLCIKCHSLGGREYQSSNPKTDIRGPNLDGVADRLRPDWTLLWLYKPQWITPYTSMPQPLPKNQKQFEELFGGDGETQTIALRDALMNYHRLMESVGKYIAQAPAAPAAAPPEAAPKEVPKDAPAKEAPPKEPAPPKEAPKEKPAATEGAAKPDDVPDAPAVPPKPDAKPEAPAS